MEHGHAAEADSEKHGAKHERPAMRPCLHRQVERHLQHDDQQCVHREQNAVERLAVVQIAHEEERHRALMLIEHDRHQEDAGEKHHCARIAQHTCLTTSLAHNAIVATHLERREGTHREERGQEEPSDERAHAVGDEEQRKRYRREKSADGGFALLGTNERRQRGKGGRPHRLRDERPNERDDQKRPERARERKEEQNGARHDERATQHAEGAESIAEPAGNRSADQTSDAVHGERRSGECQPHAEMSCHVQHHERNDHGTGAIDERRREYDPHRRGQTADAAPWVAHGKPARNLPGGLACVQQMLTARNHSGCPARNARSICPR